MQNDRVCDQVDVFRPLVKSRKIPTMIGDQKRVQSTSSTRHAAIDPRYRHAVRLNNRSCDDTSFKTLHLFLKIKVLRPPVEIATVRVRSVTKYQCTASPYAAPILDFQRGIAALAWGFKRGQRTPLPESSKRLPESSKRPIGAVIASRL